jgi:hypothetical protein
VRVQLGGQQCRIKVYQRRSGLFLDLYVNDSPIITGVIARDRVAIVRDAYLGFFGDLAFIDTQGTSDPTYSGLGSRFLLVWG